MQLPAPSGVDGSMSKLCVRYYRRKQDGTILTRDCPVGAQRRRRWWVGVVATLVGALFGFLTTKKAEKRQLKFLKESVEVEQGGARGHARLGNYETQQGGGDGFNLDNLRSTSR